MRVACVLAQGFEDSEFQVPYDRLRAAGHTVTVIGDKAGAVLDGYKHKQQATVETAIDRSRPGDYDALLIPGGHSPDQLRADERFVQFTKAFARKPIFAVCHGPQLLMTAGMVKDRTLTAWKTVQGDLKLAGAHVVDREVVVDGNLVTSRSPADLDAFVRESLKLLGTGEHASSGATH